MPKAKKRNRCSRNIPHSDSFFLFSEKYLRLFLGHFQIFLSLLQLTDQFFLIFH